MYGFDLHSTIVAHLRKWILEEEMWQFRTLYIMSSQKCLLKRYFANIFLKLEINVENLLTLKSFKK